MNPIERGVIMTMRQQAILTGKILQRHIATIAVIAMQDNMGGAGQGLHLCQEMLGGDALPKIIKTRPLGNAVDIGDGLNLRLSEKIRPTPRKRLGDSPVYGQFPIRERDGRLYAQI